MLVGVGSPEKSDTQPGGKLKERKLPRDLNLEKERSEHLNWTHLDQVQHFTELPYPTSPGYISKAH